MLVESPELAERGWSTTRTELLKLHYALGLSAAVSAQLIGEVSRNAVISKRRRLGLMGANPLRYATGIAGCSQHTFDHGPLPRYAARPRSLEVRAVAIARTPLPFMDLPAPADADPKTLANRVAGECAWPLGPAEAPGDYRTLFCCAPVSPGRVYCSVHQARAFSGPAPALSIDCPAATATPRRINGTLP